MKTRTPMDKAGMEVVATKDELDAAIIRFQASLFRGDTPQINVRRDEAMSALERHLDAKAANWAVVQRDFKP